MDIWDSSTWRSSSRRGLYIVQIPLPLSTRLSYQEFLTGVDLVTCPFPSHHRLEAKTCHCPRIRLGTSPDDKQIYIVLTGYCNPFLFFFVLYNFNTQKNKNVKMLFHLTDIRWTWRWCSKIRNRFPHQALYQWQYLRHSLDCTPHLTWFTWCVLFIFHWFFSM